MRGVTIVAAIGAALAAGAAAAGAPQDMSGRIVFVSERAPDFGRTRFVALTSTSSRVKELGIAPLGAVLATDGVTYAVGRGRELLIGRLGGGEPRVVAHSPYAIADVVWSPDRAHIAFTAIDPSPCAPGYKLCVAYPLFTVSVDGGTPTQIAARARHPVWSPNSRWIAFAGEWNTYDANDNGASGTPYVARADGSTARRLLRVRGVRSLAWGPRSDRLAVATGRNVVITVRLAGGTRGVGRGSVVAWSKDNRIAAADGSTIVVTREDGRPRHRIRAVSSLVYALAWSPRGVELAYAGYLSGTFPAPRVAAITKPGRRTRTPLATEPSQNVALAGWQGSRLIVATMRDSVSDTDVYTMRADGSDVRAVTRSGDYEFMPTSSPDGSSLAFTGRSPSAYPQSAVFTIRSDGRDRAPLTTPPPGTDDYDPAWSPDGGSIVFVRSHAAEGLRQSDLFVIRPDGTGLRQLTRLAGEVRGPVWSPDGSQVAFGRLVGWHGAVAVVSADGSGYRELTTVYGSPLPAWSPDGRRLAFVHPHTPNIVLLEIAAGGATEIPARADLQSALAWSPDSSRIVYGADDGDLHSIAVTGADDVRLTSEPGRDQDPDWSGAAP